MDSPRYAVREFHEALGLPVPDRPVQTPQGAAADPEVTILAEELKEIQDAAKARSIIGLAHELADLVYGAYGIALTNGIDLDAVLDAVHQSNMSKIGPDGQAVVREDGKVLKGPHYRPPAVAAVLAAGPGGVRRWRRSDLSTLVVLQAIQTYELDAWEFLTQGLNVPPKVALAALDRDYSAGLVQYGGSLRRCWLTIAGEQLLAAAQAEAA